MLWSLLKIILFILITIGLMLGLTELTQMENLGRLELLGREWTITPLLGLIGVLAILLAAYILFKVVGLIVATIRFLNGDETAISRYFDRRSERKGYEALGEGMMALAAGEGRLAIRKAERAQRLLGRPELSNLIVSQGAEMVGDKALATKTFRDMVVDDRTKFLGVRGLMKQKLDEGDTDTAMKLAEKAMALRPKNAEVQTTLIGLQSKNEEWSKARATLSQALKSGNLPRDVHRRRDAVLALAHARDALAEGQIATAQRDAAEANRLVPGLVPAAVMASRLSVEAGNKRQAVKVIRKAWDLEPHPDLAAAFADIEPDETPALRLRRFRPLLGKHSGHAEVKLLEAELHIANEDFPAARRALGDLPETDPTVRSLTIMAAIERGEGAEDRIVNAWLARAVTASRGPQWVCEIDGKAYPEWVPVTEGGFDTLTWKALPQSEAALARPAQMLPLIVGVLEDQRSAAPEAEDAVVADETAVDAEVVEAPAPETTEPAQEVRN